jgi:hypothetical protein
MIKTLETVYAKMEDPDRGKVDVKGKNIARDALKKGVKSFFEVL